jgi:hypothetical protein
MASSGFVKLRANALPRLSGGQILRYRKKYEKKIKV